MTQWLQSRAVAPRLADGRHTLSLDELRAGFGNHHYFSDAGIAVEDGGMRLGDTTYAISFVRMVSLHSDVPTARRTRRLFVGATSLTLLTVLASLPLWLLDPGQNDVVFLSAPPAFVFSLFLAAFCWRRAVSYHRDPRAKYRVTVKTAIGKITAVPWTFDEARARAVASAVGTAILNAGTGQELGTEGRPRSLSRGQ